MPLAPARAPATPSDRGVGGARGGPEEMPAARGEGRGGVLTGGPGGGHVRKRFRFARQSLGLFSPLSNLHFLVFLPFRQCFLNYGFI